MSKIDMSGGPDACWPFTGAITGHGYGNFYLQGAYTGAHRAAWLLMEGEIPEDLEVDHLCHNADKECSGGKLCLHRRCANWIRHLRLTTHRENDLQGRGVSAINVLVEKCPADHTYDLENTYCYEGHRYCRKCHAASERRRRAKKVTEL